MREVTITFTVSSNNALLLQALHDWITRPHPGDPFVQMQDSMAFMEYMPWLIDEITEGLRVWEDLRDEGVITKEELSSGATKALLAFIRSQ